MPTKDNPGARNHYEELAPDEPYFLLVAHDVHAPHLLRMWAVLREAYVEAGLKPPSDMMTAEQARQVAYQMERWRHTNEAVQQISMEELEVAELARLAKEEEAAKTAKTAA